MKRLPGEDFNEYRERRKAFNKTRKFFGRTFRRILPDPKPKPKRVAYEPTNANAVILIGCFERLDITPQSVYSI